MNLESLGDLNDKEIIYLENTVIPDVSTAII